MVSFIDDFEELDLSELTDDDSLDDLDASFGELADDASGDSDGAIGDPTRRTTSDTAGIIAGHQRARGRGRVVQEAVFPVGRVPRQGTQAGPGQRAIRPDVSFVGRDGRRVNLEVDDRPQRSRAHVIQHLRAMRHAERAGLRPTASTRSVFVETDGGNHIRRVRYVGYTVDPRGRVVRNPARSFTRTYRGRAPTVAQALRRGMLDGVPARRSPRVRPGARPFDAFWAA